MATSGRIPAKSSHAAYIGVRGCGVKYPRIDGDSVRSPGLTNPKMFRNPEVGDLPLMLSADTIRSW